jgi:hypothetical protein
MKLLILIIIAISINYLCLTKEEVCTVTLKQLIQKHKQVGPTISKQTKLIMINLK